MAAVGGIDEARAAVSSGHADVVLVATSLGDDATVALVEELAREGAGPRVATWGAYADPSAAWLAIANGAGGLLSDVRPDEETAVAIAAVAEGRIVIDERFSAWLCTAIANARAPLLSERDREILERMARGDDAGATADRGGFGESRLGRVIRDIARTIRSSLAISEEEMLLRAATGRALRSPPVNPWASLRALVRDRARRLLAAIRRLRRRG